LNTVLIKDNPNGKAVHYGITRILWHFFDVQQGRPIDRILEDARRKLHPRGRMMAAAGLPGAVNKS
jgi:hypothetical protein